jgi:putative endonuclease
MGFFVYIIRSDFDHSYYKGFSERPFDRLIEHNSGMSNYTSNKIPWQLVYVEELVSKREALIREKALKKFSHQQIEKLILSTKNTLNYL